MQRVTEGMLVYSLDGERLGKIVRCDDGGFEIEKGFFFPKEYFAQYDDVARIDGDVAYLRYGRDALHTRGAAAATPKAADTRLGGMAGKREEVRVPIAEEELDVTKRVKETGEVRVRKEVRTEMKTVNVPVTREEVTVERVPVDSPRTAGTNEARFESGTLRVPIREEQVEVTKRPVIREEVKISKQAIEEQRPVSEELRKEEIEVDETPRRPLSDEPGQHAGSVLDDEVKKI